MFTLIALWSDGNKTEECDNTLCLSWLRSKDTHNSGILLSDTSNNI
jgi:hypothetical protein